MDEAEVGGCGSGWPALWPAGEDGVIGRDDGRGRLGTGLGAGGGLGLVERGLESGVPGVVFGALLFGGEGGGGIVAGGGGRRLWLGAGEILGAYYVDAGKLVTPVAFQAVKTSEEGAVERGEVGALADG